MNDSIKASASPWSVAQRARLSVLLAAVALAACGGSGDNIAAPPVSGAPAPAPEPAPAPAPSPAPAPAPTPAPAPAPTPAPAPAPGTPGALAPLTGTADTFPHAASTTMSATLSTGSAQRRDALSRDKTANYMLTLGHTNGVTTYLQVPGGAFLDDVFLTTTEVTGIGAAVSSVVAAVRVEPGDLITEVPVTVTFVVPDALLATLSRSQLVGFVADSDGSNLHLVPIVSGLGGLQVTRPALKLDHLGIAGIAVATPAQQAALAAAWPADAADQFTAALAPGLTAQWRTTAQPLSTAAGQATRPRAQATDPESPYLAPMRGYFNDVVIPSFVAAYGDPSQSLAAIQVGFSFLRNAALTGLSEPGGPLFDIAADLSGRIDALFNTYADYVAERCRSVGGPAQLQLMLSTIRLLMLQGNDAKAAQLDEALPQCSRFRADFRHEFRRTGHWTNGALINVDVHTVIEGTTTFAFNTVPTFGTTRLTTATSTGTPGTSWTPDPVTSPFAISNLSVPVVRTRGAAPITKVDVMLAAFGSVLLTVTETRTNPDGSLNSVPGGDPQIPLKVPAFPPLSPNNFGPVLIPASGSITSTATRNVPQTGGSFDETERATLTITRAE